MQIPLLTKEKMDMIIESAGITMPSDPRSRFELKRAVEHAYHLGVKAGMNDKATIDRMIKEWECEE